MFGAMLIKIAVNGGRIEAPATAGEIAADVAACAAAGHSSGRKARYEHRAVHVRTRMLRCFIVGSATREDVAAGRLDALAAEALAESERDEMKEP